MRTALDPATPVIHPSLGDNLAFERNLDAGEVDAAFAASDAVVDGRFHLRAAHRRDAGAALGASRLERRRGEADDLSGHAGAAHGAEHRGAPSRARGIAGSRGLQGRRWFFRHQGPHLRRRNGHLCAVETAAPADQIRRRPGREFQYRYSCPRSSHARGRSASTRDGTITAFEIDDLTGIGPYSMYPRTSAIEANQVVNLVGGPYVTRNYRARARVVYQNKNVMCQYRAVGHPIACSVTEGLVDLAASENRHGSGGNPAPQPDCR